MPNMATSMNEDDPVQRVKKERAEATVDLNAFLAQFGGQEIQVTISRMEPAYFRGKKTRGHVATVHDLDDLDESSIAERWGGGKYQLKIAKRDSKGRWAFQTSTMADIAGDPIVVDDGGVNEPPSSSGGNGRVDAAAASLASRALDTMEKHTREVREEMRQRERAPGFDPVLIKMAQEPFMRQLDTAQRTIEALQQRLEAKEERLYEAAARPAPPAVSDGITRMLERQLDSEGTRVEAIRVAHETELRTLRAQHQAELDRERDRLREEARAREKGHEREIEMVNRANQVAMDSMKTAFETRIDGLKSENARLQGDLDALKKETAELRSRKEKSLIDQAKDLAAVRESLDTTFGSDKDEEKGGLVERVISNVMENPGAIGEIFGGVRGAIAPGPSPEQIAAAQQQHALELQAAHAQQVRAMKRRKRRAAAHAQQAPAGAPPAAPAEGGEAEPTPPPIEMPKIPKAEVQTAIAFMENACQNGTAPDVFAASVRNFVPADLLHFMERLGIDQFLDHVGLEDGSVLRTQKGRNFSRSVFEHLQRG